MPASPSLKKKLLVVAYLFPASLSEVEYSQAHPGPLGENFAEAVGEYSERLEALSPQSERREGLDTCTPLSGGYLAMATLSTLGFLRLSVTLAHA